MRTAVLMGTLIGALLAIPAVAQNNLPACNRQVVTRNGNELSISTNALSNMLNQKLQAAHSNFSNLKLNSTGNGSLKLTGKKNGTPMSISGPLSVANNGDVSLHAKQITRNGTHEKDMMSLFGKDLADFVNPSTSSVSVKGNNLRINPDKLLNVKGQLQNVQLQASNIKMQFASQPCR